MKSQIAHDIKHRDIPNDNFRTPIELARRCIALIPFTAGDLVLDPARGGGAFYNNYPDFVSKDWCEVDLGRNFLLYPDIVDWVVTNPPYSVLNTWLEKTSQISRKGFAYLIHLHSITPKRLEMINNYGFGLTGLYLCKVYKWFGMSAFCIWQRGKPAIIQYDRIVWRES